MSNHVHLIAVPRKSDGLAQALKQTHGRYAFYWNAGHQSSGHVWQGRYYSCPLDEPHLWEALRYTELNPLRAREVESKLAVIRQPTHTGQPLGTAEFIQGPEKATQRRLTLQKRGPREKSSRIAAKANLRSILRPLISQSSSPV